MPVPTHTPGQSTVTAVQLAPVYPSDSLFPSDFAYPDTTFALVGPLGATVVGVINRAVVAAVVNDAHLAAVSAGGAALTSSGVRQATLATDPVAAALIQLT